MTSPFSTVVIVTVCLPIGDILCVHVHVMPPPVRLSRNSLTIVNVRNRGSSSEYVGAAGRARAAERAS